MTQPKTPGDPPWGPRWGPPGVLWTEFGDVHGGGALGSTGTVMDVGSGFQHM